MDEQFLAQLANQLFKAAPNESVDLQPFLDQSHVNTGGIPASVAGSGISPSVQEEPGQSQFSIDDPQTSLPDPHFYNSKIPASVAGSGKSPSAQNQQVPFEKEQVQNVASNSQPVAQNASFNGLSTLNPFASGNLNPFASTNLHPFSIPADYSHLDLPFAGDNGFEQQLQAAISQINSLAPTAQIPNAAPVGFGDPQFYFFNGPSNAAAVGNFVKPPFDINNVRNDFPILKERVNGKQLIWLDNAATTHKPRFVIDRLSHFYQHENSNIHRAAHELAARSTDAYEAARKKVQHFLNAKSPNEIVFLRGTTEAINLVAQSWGDQNIHEGDEIILSHLEHHANIVPWQILAKKKGAVIKVIPVDDDGQIILEEYGKLLCSKTKLVAFTAVSNALGTITPAKVIIDMAHSAGAKVLLDGAQSISHIPTDVQALNTDWFVFSGHKIYAPTGIGALYGKEDLLNEMQPWQGGGNMIQDVTFEHTKYHAAPAKFEAGTGNIADAVGLGAALDYVSRLGIENIAQYEHALLHYATQVMQTVPGLKFIGTAHEKTSVLSFVLQGYSNDDVGKALNQEGIAVRTGHHCAQPILRRFGVESTVRPSIAFYNTCAEIDTLVATLHLLKRK